MDRIVIKINIRFVLMFKLDEAKTLGIIKNTEKGFKIPPVKYNRRLNCRISANK